MIPDAYFDRFSTPKYRNPNPVQRLLIRRFVRELHDLFVEALPAQTVLEVGVGEGFLSGYLAEKLPGTKFVGVDSSAGDLAELSRRFPTIETHCASLYDVADLGVRPDVLLCCEVLEHVDDPARAVEVLRGLEPKQAIFSVPHEPFFMLSNLARGKNVTRLGNDIDHVNHWGGRSFRRLLERSFRVDRFATSYPWLLARSHPR
ncbi:MAG: methyltransferase domain-containing protein [Polyangiaceae bacterium]|nr:methyltransferase domain-containing protein [Polyangiaceae bacterium]